MKLNLPFLFSCLKKNKKVKLLKKNERMEEEKVENNKELESCIINKIFLIGHHKISFFNRISKQTWKKEESLKIHLVIEYIQDEPSVSNGINSILKVYSFGYKSFFQTNCEEKSKMKTQY
jgi:hypothetical protein